LRLADRAAFVDSRKNTRSQSAPTVITQSPSKMPVVQTASVVNSSEINRIRDQEKLRGAINQRNSGADLSYRRAVV
jgi:hypothetical protein